MAIITNSAQNYYQQLPSNTPNDYGRDLGGYQFVSLNNIIDQFMFAYVGEEKIIGKIRRADVAFHAQRALAELSFDTFKSIKSLEIALPPSLTMILPQDYVNYVRLSWSNGDGIHRRLYPTRYTSNPFRIKQDDDGNYEFTPNFELTQNNEFSDGILAPWSKVNLSSYMSGRAGRMDRIWISSGRLAMQTHPLLQNVQNANGSSPGQAASVGNSILSVWQQIDVRLVETLNIEAAGESAAATYVTGSSGTISDVGKLWFGISSTEPTPYTSADPNHNKPAFGINPPDLGYLEWIDGTATSIVKNTEIDVSDYDTVWVLITSTTVWNDTTYDAGTDTMLGFTNLTGPPVKYNYNYTGNVAVNYIDNISVTSESTEDLLFEGSNMWSNYSDLSTSTTDDAEAYNYDTDIYDLNIGQRYGIEPELAQVNGSFYIDELRGRINFSSNMSGNDIILEYISDSLGTGGEGMVHKLAEEAMYKWILCAVMSTRMNVPEYAIARYKKEKFAAVRQAKLRLSNYKIEEIAQIMRGKSKWIKH